MKDKICVKKYWSYIVATIFIGMVIVLACVLGERMCIQIHDNLDSNIIWYKMLRDNNLWFSHGEKVPFLGGVTRDIMPSEMLAYTWLYILFPPFVAYITGFILRIIIAISGFVYAAKSIDSEHFDDNRSIVVLCGLIYGIMPYFPSSGFAFASLGWLIGLVFNLRKTGKNKYFLFLFLYPVFSRLATFGFFICIYVGVVFIVDSIMKKRLQYKMLLAAIVLGMGYIFAEYRVFYHMLLSGVPTIKSEVAKKYYSFSEIILYTGNLLKDGQYHAGSIHKYIILPVVIVGLIITNVMFIRRKKRVTSNPVNWLFIIVVMNSFIAALDKYEPLKNLFGLIMPPLKNFSIERFIWFNPLIWCVLFITVLCILQWNQKLKPVVYLVIALQIGAILVFPSTYNDLGRVFSNSVRHNIPTLKLPAYDESQLTYEEFYSVDLFERIKDDINYDGEYSCAYGMHPAVLNYNGIKTLDGYCSAYELEYKDKFREIIAPELVLDEKNRDYFETWGARAYLYGTEYLPYRVYDDSGCDIYIDRGAMKRMGGMYIFSRTVINNYEEQGLSKVGEYADEHSSYIIRVYRVE